MTRFYKADPDRTSGKVKLTPPVNYIYTTMLLVLTLSITQTTQSSFKEISFWLVWQAQVEISGLVKTWLHKNQWCTGEWTDIVGQTFSVLLYYISATKKAAQLCHLSGLQV